ncbi:hypothetical protein C7I87_32205 [Mesorhizobium sp. SARCC-RB16n]|uniref:DUF680 domain-containing protein n=1 Tax=Mesorhizobium sp. SARCC-RB16n TaxID=2116687 RepID=UPI00122F5D0C|nr:DUF680 domain-containing protein [Mesorhizobium sp. SARCC-RB16n]KAA3442106.1 hypothetical protein C7I87_32205 [Mesorhizobium sp. SARCC-RB16n]
MKKIALTAAAILIATGTAFAGSDHYGSNNANQPTAPIGNVDNTFTGSIQKSDRASDAGRDAAQRSDLTINAPAQSGQGIWGR